jgi:hypothetical protein
MRRLSLVATAWAIIVLELRRRAVQHLVVSLPMLRVTDHLMAAARTKLDSLMIRIGERITVIGRL